MRAINSKGEVTEIKGSITIDELGKTVPRIANEFRSLAIQLSPENLYCDGEISQAEANVKLRNIMSKWRRLEKLLNVKVVNPEMCW